MRLAACLLSLMAVPAVAGDLATLSPLGFSRDGRTFAFEQYGIQDGSGFPYSEILVTDLDGERAFEPVRVRLENEGATLGDARAEALDRAESVLSGLGPLDDGLLVAANPPTELSADPHRVVFRPRAVEPSPDEPVELRLALIPFFEADESCTVFGNTVNGFRLTRVSTEPGEPARLIHEDEAEPQDRRCPYDYRIAEVRVHTDADWNLRAVVLIGIVQVGFEGPDMRYMAVPLPLD